MALKTLHLDGEDPLIWVSYQNLFYKTGFFYIEGTLIDCGPPKAITALKKLIHAYPVKVCLLTHHHAGHAGGSSLLNSLNIQPFLSLEGIERYQSLQKRMPFFRRWTLGIPKPATFQPLKENEPIEVPPHTFHGIPTPGHSQDHWCFWEPTRGWLFTGDLYRSSHTMAIQKEENIDLLLQSLEKLIQLPIQVLFCAHRGGIKDGKYHLTEKLRILLELRDMVQYHHQKGLSEKAIAENLKLEKSLFRWLPITHTRAIHLVEKLIQSNYRPKRQYF